MPMSSILYTDGFCNILELDSFYVISCIIGSIAE